MLHLKPPGSFYTAVLSAAFSLALVFIPSPVHVVQVIGVVAFLLSVLTAVLSLRESQRSEKAVQRRMNALESSTGVGRTLSNLFQRRRPLGPVRKLGSYTSVVVL